MKNTSPLLAEIFANWDLDALKEYQTYLLHKEDKNTPEINALPVVSLMITLKTNLKSNEDGNV